jgi:hypothetical protein
MLPDALLFQGAEEPLDDPILLGRVGGNELLLQPIVSIGRAKLTTLKNQSVAPDHRGSPGGPLCPESIDASFLDGPLSFLGASSKSKLLAQQLLIAAVDHPH